MPSESGNLRCDNAGSRWGGLEALPFLLEAVSQSAAFDSPSCYLIFSAEMSSKLSSFLSSFILKMAHAVSGQGPFCSHRSRVLIATLLMSTVTFLRHPCPGWRRGLLLAFLFLPSSCARARRTAEQRTNLLPPFLKAAVPSGPQLHAVISKTGSKSSAFLVFS